MKSTRENISESIIHVIKLNLKAIAPKVQLVVTMHIRITIIFLNRFRLNFVYCFTNLETSNNPVT